MKLMQMKGFLALALLGALAAALLGGCGNQSEQEDLLAQVDDSMIERFIVAPEAAMGSETDWLFDNASALSSPILFQFFQATSGLTALQVDLQDDGLYHIPVATINETLDQYFTGYQFDPADIDGYNKAEDTVDTQQLSGFGGERTVKVTDKKQKDNQVVLTVDLYAPGSEDQVTDTKVYTLEKAGDSFRYVSVIMK